MLKADQQVQDCLVVGIPDDRFGQRVAAVVAFRAEQLDPQAAIKAISEGQLAGYKVPRKVVAVEQIQRGPNGKPDLKWARELAAQ